MHIKTENQLTPNDARFIHRSLCECYAGTMGIFRPIIQATKLGITCNCYKYKLYSIIIILPVRADLLWVSVDSLLSSMCLQSCGIS